MKNPNSITISRIENQNTDFIYYKMLLKSTFYTTSKHSLLHSYKNAVFYVLFYFYFVVLNGLEEKWIVDPFYIFQYNVWAYPCRVRQVFAKIRFMSGLVF